MLLVPSNRDWYDILCRKSAINYRGPCPFSRQEDEMVPWFVGILMAFEGDELKPVMWSHSQLLVVFWKEKMNSESMWDWKKLLLVQNKSKMQKRNIKGSKKNRRGNKRGMDDPKSFSLFSSCPNFWILPEPSRFLYWFSILHLYELML